MVGNITSQTESIKKSNLILKIASMLQEEEKINSESLG